jgi:dienelactone hydrolase
VTVLVTLGLLLVALPGAAADSPALWGRLTPGPHTVGFRVLRHRDAARTQPDGSRRPVQISLWYPAAGTQGAPLRYGDYVLVSAGETTLAEPTPAEAAAALAAYRRFLASNGVPEAGVAAWMEAPLAAHRDAPAVRAPSPLVLIAQGNGGAVQDQAVLGEFLASHGFVVATCPSPVRLGARMESDADVLPVAEAQALDLAFALDVLRRDRRVHTHGLGLVGYSFGARAALLLAARQPAAKALVSLDGGIGTASGGPWLTPSALDRARFRVPILHVYEEVEAFMRPDFTLLDSLAGAEQLRLKVTGLHHMDLITLGFASAALPELGMPAPERAALGERLAATFTYALRFLQANVSADAAARRFVAREPSANGYPAALLAGSRK